MFKSYAPEKTKNDDPRYLSGEILEKLGVERLNRYNLMLKCRFCKDTWSPALDSDGLLRAGYWRCPNGCNG